MAAPKMRWTFDMKLLLDELFSDTHSDLSPTQRCQAFNGVFADEIRDFGFTEGVPYRRLTVQYHEKKKPNVPKDWMTIAIPTNAQQARREALRVQIDDVLHAGRAVAQPRPPKKASTSNGKKRLADPDETSLPLSKRPAVATWEPATPRSLPSGASSSSRKLTTPKNPSGASKKNPPRALRKLAIPKTPATKIPFTKPDGTTIMRSSNSKPPRTEVLPFSPHLVQPPLPKLLFRLYKADNSSQRDSRNGFWSRKHYKANALASRPTHVSYIDPLDVLHHMNDDDFPSPFISTSNSLVWIVRQSLDHVKNHSEYRLAVIDVDALDKRGVYWARPLHNDVRQTYGFSNGAWHYCGTHEFLVHMKIPKAAILHTINASELTDIARAAPDVDNLLHLNFLVRENTIGNKALYLRENRGTLHKAVVGTLATLTSFFGISVSSPAGHISTIVTLICEGWELRIERRGESEWQVLANSFTDQLCSMDQSTDVGFKQRQIIKFAFLDGVAWGCGHANARHTTAGIARKVKNATAVGLACPADILAHEMDSIKLTLKLSEKTEQQRLLNYHNQARNQLLYDEGARDIDVDMSEHEEPSIHTPAIDDDLYEPVVTSDEEIMFDPEEADDVFAWG